MIIKFYDNENSNYPLIEIKDNSLIQFEKDLNEYRDLNQEDYNNLDFYDIIANKEYFIRLISYDKEVFF